MNEAVLICRVRPARRRALATAQAEAVSLLSDLGAETLSGGPLSEQGGVYWLSLPEGRLPEIRARLPRLGYTSAVHQLAAPGAGREAVRWHGRNYGLERLYREEETALRAAAPDRRAFALPIGGEVRLVRGYRGDSGPLSRRGLPVYDARLLVNLTSVRPGARFLDPFAGVGGVVIEANAAGACAVSCDKDPFLRYGLERLTGGRHCLADATHLPFRDGAFDAVASEPPYEASAAEAVTEALAEAHRVLRPGGRLALFCARWQMEPLKAESAALGLLPLHEAPIDRKGTACGVLAWGKP